MSSELRASPDPPDTGGGVGGRRYRPSMGDTSGLPPHPDPVLAARGLPDYSAMIAAQLAAAPATRSCRYIVARGGELNLTARELTGLSRRRLAALACTSQAAINAMETGNRLPTIRTLLRIADAAGSS
jgi:hypothetical protein